MGVCKRDVFSVNSVNESRCRIDFVDTKRPEVAETTNNRSRRASMTRPSGEFRHLASSRNTSVDGHKCDNTVFSEFS